jgi:serine/threonine protein kinase
MFERSQSIGVNNEKQCELYRRLSDSSEIVVQLIHHFDVQNSRESENRLEVQSEIEKQMNLKHPCVAAPFGFVISSNWTALKIVRVYSPIGSLEKVLQTSPSWWTMTMKSITVVGIVLGLRFVHSFGLVCMNLKPTNILFDHSHRIQIVDIIPNQTALYCRENFDESTRQANRVLSKFVAPEVLIGHKPTQKADVYSFALILFSIVVGHYPFEETDDRGCWAERDVIVDGDAIPRYVSGFVRQLILSGLSTNPNDRPSFNDIIAVLKENNFKIVEEVDSEAVFAFFDSVELSES